MFNAVTFTPALAALLLDKQATRAWPVLYAASTGRIDGGTESATSASCAARIRWTAGLMMLALFVARARRDLVGVSRGARRRSCPTKTRATSSRSCRRRPARRSDYTTNIMKQAEKVYLAPAGSRGRLLGRRLQLLSGAASNSGPDVRRGSRTSRSGSGRAHSLHGGDQPAARSADAGFLATLVIPVAPPPIQGLSSFGGFQFEVLDSIRRRHRRSWPTSTQQLAMAGNKSRSRRWSVLAASRANDPQLVVEIDRDRARSLGLPIREVTDALGGARSGRST